MNRKPISTFATGPSMMTTTDGGMIVPSDPPAQYRSGNQFLVVVVFHHRRNRDQANHGFGCADHTAGRGEHDAKNYRADREAAGYSAGPQMDRFE